MSDLSGRALAFYAATMVPALAWFTQTAPMIPTQRSARVIMLAIAGQESDWRFRVQGGNGPAHSFWQDEKMGAVNGVLHHPLTGTLARDLCAAQGVRPNAQDVWDFFATPAGDFLACAFARLLLWTDARAIPTDAAGTWAYYLRNWRPGAPRPDAWPGYFDAADVAVPPEALS